MSTLNAHSTMLLSMFLTSLTVPNFIVNAYVIRSHALTELQQRPATSPLASKVIYQSPSMENVYKEFLVSSKPLNFRKYNSNGIKTKKTKKDSKIYYIPMPPLPYRYIPGVGYDYQPMKINPIMKEKPAEVANMMADTGYSQMKSPKRKPGVSNAYKGSKIELGENETHQRKPNPVTAESKIVYVPAQRGDFLFNGRPFRLQIAHARAKDQVTPENLKSKFYFNKEIIY